MQRESYSTVQVSLAAEAFNAHARTCYRCADIAATFARGEEPCTQGDAITRPIRSKFKSQDAEMQKQFGPEALNKEIYVLSALEGASLRLLFFLNQRRREKIRQTPSPVMQYREAIPVPSHQRPYQYGPGASLEVNGSRTRYGHSRSGSDTTASIPSNSPQSQFYHPPSSYPPRSGAYLDPNTIYQTHHASGRRRERRQVHFEDSR